MRAQIRGGEILIEMAERGERAKSGEADGSGRTPSVPRLTDLGVTKTESSRWQQLASLPYLPTSSNYTINQLICCTRWGHGKAK